jgi:protein-S-isoprenylcysteine O-methyltransferase Ste14
MGILASIIIAIWILFIVVWLVFAADTKRYVRRSTTGVRILIFLVVIGILRVPAMRKFLSGVERSIWSPALGSVGVALVALGLALAIWARVHLGRNWGMPMSIRQDAELVTSGPYAFVRHPIYTGIILAMLGSTLVSIWWMPAFILFSSYFVWSAKTEEKIMREQFTDQYPEYMKRTKMLVPFVL